MTKKFFLTLLAFAAGIFSVAYAQDEPKENEVTVSAQIRTRGEYRNGALNPRGEGDDPAAFINERARLSIGYSRKDLSMKFSAQHVGVWGQDALTDKTGRFILNEAWARVAMGESWFVQLGRQSLSYDDERLFGGLDWNVAGRWHDALKVGYEKGQHKLHAIFAFNQNDESTSGGTYYDNSSTSLYKNMQTLWYHFQSSSAPFGISLLFSNIGYEAGESGDEATKYLQTFGTHITYNPGAFNLVGSFYYQTGKTTADRSVSAFMGSVKATWNISSKWSVFAGEDYLSGSDSSTGDYKAFNPLYGTHHKFYGAMDYFYASSFQSGYAPGLSDTQIGASFKISNPLKASATYHYFAMAADLDDLDKGLGSEIDLQLDWKIQKDVSLTIGYSTMFASSSMDTVKGGSHDCWQDWCFIALNINPSFFFKF